ncbi:hypothetical protein HPP92_017815 [Vanilla planifolia]|uniref:DNA repair protein RAD51 homolog 3 n=1 Tax=Vanilla planifolia TaxID=51239 RepID=A0A835UNS7_VANPL|nr:hypothetical protein HPP92_017815 [Vanilla planifolia]
MEISILPISSIHKDQLIRAGYTSLESLVVVSPYRLAQELNILQEEALHIVKEALKYSGAGGVQTGRSFFKGCQSAWEMLEEEKILNYISTGCEDFDDILGGGISCKEVTEVGGVPGIGKTQLGIQLAINVQVPLAYGGLGGKAVYIDTEGSFMPERAYQVAEACIMDTLDKFAFHKDFEICKEVMQPKFFLSNIIYFRICSYTEQISVINNLHKFLEERKDVKVVIIDSITFHFRRDFKDMLRRTRVLADMSQKLMKLAKGYNLAVVLLNQVTTKFTEGSYQLTLALGDTWAHCSTSRVILYWNGNDRYAHIEKSPSLPSASAPFAINGKGIRNVASTCKRARVT